MLKPTLSAITAIVIGTSGLSAEAVDKSVSVSISPNADAKKEIIVVPTNTVPVTPPTAEAPTVALTPTPAQCIQPVQPSHGYADTIIYASGAKSNYYVNEPIHIRLKLKRRAFIYFWTIGSSGKSYRILPNDITSYNDFKANTNYVVPERSANYDFKSDREGVEKIYIIATNKKIGTAKLKSIFGQKSVSNKNMKKFLTKDIHAVARTQNLKYDIASFQINVHNRNPQPTVNITVNQ